MAKKRMNPLTVRILIEMAVLVTAVIVLVVWIGNVWAGIAPEAPGETEPSQTQQTEPEDTVPQDTSPEGILQTFMTENALTVDDYPYWFEEVYEIAGENRDFLLNYPLKYGIKQEIDISDVDRTTVPLFIQWDDRWGYLDYNGNICGVSGCGPVSLSMVAYYLTGNPVYSPDYMLNFATVNGYAVFGSGTSWDLFNKGAKELGFEVKTLAKVEKHVADKLKAGIPVVVSMAPGTFTTTGHFMVLVGYEDGKFRINDCNSPEKSERLWAWEEFEAEVRQFWAISLPSA